MTPAATTMKPPARRGRKATHDPEELLALVAEVVTEAAIAQPVLAPAQVSMPGFNAAKRDVDIARGVDPAGPERTPTADAIQMRFKALADEPVVWSEIVEGALRPPAQRTMWLAALRRSDARHDLTDDVVVHALRRVAHERRTDILAMSEYQETRDELVGADQALHGDEGLLDWVLPTANQVLAHSGMEWAHALKLAGLKPPRSAMSRASRRRKATPPPQAPGASFAQVVAHYGALNGVWPSDPLILEFARACAVRLETKPPGGLGPVREAAAALLIVEGMSPPSRTRGGGKAKRLTYRYPVDGIPGLPVRRPRAGRSQESGPQPHAKPTIEARERAVLSLRVWLASLETNDRRVRSAYVKWAVESPWVSASVFDRGLGGFSALKAEASGANARDRREHRRDLGPEAQALAEALLAAYAAPRPVATPEPAHQVVREPAAVPFGEALRAVLAGPHAEVQAPKQRKAS